jgi:uncharacterized protein
MERTENGHVVDVQETSRYELRVDGEMISHAEYALDGDVMAILHVETRVPYRDRGNAARLMEGVVADARRRGLRIKALCSFAASHMREHPEHDDVLDRG